MDINKISQIAAELVKEAEAIKKYTPIIQQTKVAISNLKKDLATLEDALNLFDADSIDEVSITEDTSKEIKEDQQGRINYVRKIIRSKHPITSKGVIEEYKSMGLMNGYSDEQIKVEEQSIRYALNSLKNREEIIKEGDSIFTGVWKPTNKFKG